MELSVAIVSYNQLFNLLKCVASLRAYSKGINYEIIVVAYLFSPKNLAALRNALPDAEIIESNEIRGFSENYNLALRRARGDFCLVLNDDTFFEDDTVRILMETFKTLSDAQFVIPLVLNYDGSVQICGREKYGLLDWFLLYMPFNVNVRNKRSADKTGIFKTGGISGCCFMARREALYDLGCFCEDYFFCPEDVALSVEAEKKGYGIYVNTAGTVIHQHGATAGPIHDIILPVALRGTSLLIGRQYGCAVEMIFMAYTFGLHFLLYLAWHFRRGDDKKKIWIRACKNVMRHSFSSLPPKMLFQKLYRNKGML